MNEASAPAGRKGTLAGGFSLGAKFVGLTAGLILLLSVTAFVSLHQSAETVRQFGSVVQFAIPAYGALARSHIRSLEQAVELRRALLAALDPTAAAGTIDKHIERFSIAQTEFNRELADAEQLIRGHSKDAEFEVVAAELQGLLGRIGELDALIRDYGKETAAFFADVAAHRFSEARQRLVKIDGLRDELGTRLEATRSGMFGALKLMAAEAAAAQTRARTATVVVFVLSSVLGLIVAAIGAVRLIRAIRSVVRGAEAVEGGNLETRIEIASRDEIGHLAASFNRMIDGLRMRDLIRDTFGKYVDRRVAEQLIQSRGPLAERGDRREVAVMFCDLAGFTALSERVDAEALVQFLNAFFSLIAREIAATDGIIDKFIGDGVMAYWCPPFVPAEQIAARGAEAALRCRDQMETLTIASREIIGDGPRAYDPRIRIGIATGHGIMGSIGATDRRNYTVIGDTANLASRMEGVNRLYGTGNLVCSQTAKAIRQQFVLREIDTVLLPGIDTPQGLFEILGRTGQVSTATEKLRSRYSAALAAYRRGDWIAARSEFASCLETAPDDGPTRTMLARIDLLSATPATSVAVGGAWRLGKESLA